MLSWKIILKCFLKVFMKSYYNSLHMCGEHVAVIIKYAEEYGGKCNLSNDKDDEIPDCQVKCF